MDRITEHIWLGGNFDQQCDDCLSQAGITSILSVAQEVDKLCPAWLRWNQIPMQDRGNQQVYVYKGVWQLADYMNEGETSLVHCLLGMSRSPFIILCYLYTSNYVPPPCDAKAGLIDYDFVPRILLERYLDEKALRIYDWIWHCRDLVNINLEVLAMFPKLNFELMCEGLNSKDHRQIPAH